MIAKKHRFHGHNSVSRVRGRRVNTPFFTIFYKISPKRQDYRMAVVVSKRIAKSAVTRNRIRRRLYESVRKDARLNGKPIDAVFVVRDAQIAKMPVKELTQHITRALKKILNSN